MALSRVTTWSSGDVLTAAALNGEFNNLINGGVAIVSPYTATMDANNKQTVNFILEKLAAALTPANTGRLYYRTDNLLPEYDTGTNTRTIPNFVWSGGRLTLSAPNLLFSPYANNLIPINGRLEIIPDAGVTIGVGGLAPTTTYQIYAFMSGATLTLETSATARAVQAGTGIPIKSGDATRTWLGVGITDGATAWTIPFSMWSPVVGAKGDLVAGLTANVGGRLAVGTDNQILIADSTQTLGIKWGTAQIFTKSYTSAQQTITAGGALTLAHGLSATPTLVQCRLVCTVGGGEGGYAQNDELFFSPIGLNTTVTGRGVSIVPDGTNLNVRYGSNANTFDIINKSDGTFFETTNANWKMVFRAWA